MTTVSPTTSGSSTTASQTASDAYTDNYQMFLTLLTTQLQNQDPLEPMDSSEFTQQLADFTAVEQAIATNSNLETLIALSQGTMAADSISYVGKDVTADTDEAALKDGEATWNYALDADATEVKFTVADENGKVVYEETIGATEEGSHTFSWDGETTSGTTLTEGAYTLTVAATDSSGNAVDADLTVTGTVTAVDLTGSIPIFIVDGLEIPMTSIVTVSEPEAQSV
ncbi:MAG: flagellar hook assembly protein FlgD [Alphaproteobacteria bacterium]|nr:flagellar hook assembly protein FlgD [Alphaproteobacteria bacterium]